MGAGGAECGCAGAGGARVWVWRLVVGPKREPVSLWTSCGAPKGRRVRVRVLEAPPAVRLRFGRWGGSPGDPDADGGAYLSRGDLLGDADELVTGAPGVEVWQGWQVEQTGGVAGRAVATPDAAPTAAGAGYNVRGLDEVTVYAYCTGVIAAPTVAVTVWVRCAGVWTARESLPVAELVSGRVLLGPDDERVFARVTAISGAAGAVVGVAGLDQPGTAPSCAVQLLAVAVD